MRFSFHVPGKPLAQGSMRDYGHGITHANINLGPWRHAVGWYAVHARPGHWSPDGPMRVEATFWLPRPKSHYLWRKSGPVLRPDAPWWPTTKPDSDKMTRALLDALDIAGIYGDDSQVVQLTAEKSYGPPALWCAVTRLTEKRGEADG